MSNFSVSSPVFTGGRVSFDVLVGAVSIESFDLVIKFPASEVGADSSAVTYIGASGWTVLGNSMTAGQLRLGGYSTNPLSSGTLVSVSLALADSADKSLTISYGGEYQTSLGQYQTIPLQFETLNKPNQSPTGTVNVSGTVKEGQTLTVSNSLADADGLGSVVYRWRADGQAIAGGTGSTFTLTAAQVGKKISVTASYTDGDGNQEAVTSASTTVVESMGSNPLINTAPVATASVLTVMEDAASIGILLATDADNTSLTYIIIEPPILGSVTLGADGAYTYTPTKDASGTDSFTFKASDGLLDSNPATVSITVAPINDAPTAVSSSATINEDTVLNAALVAATDIDGDPVTFSKVTDPLNGSVTITASGLYTYTPATHFNGSDSFTFAVSDGKGGSNTYTVNLSVAAVNDTPTGAVFITGTALSGQTLSAQNTLADPDGLGNLSYQWQSDGKDISGAIGPALTLTTLHIGTAISVLARYMDAQGTAESMASAATSPVGVSSSGSIGSDTLSGTVGLDQLGGGLGDDNYIVDSQDDLIFEGGSEGNDTVVSSASFYLYPNVENLTLTGSAFFGVGNELANVLTGNDQENLLIGGLGSDTVRGGNARDALFGESGDDLLQGDAGIDYLVAGSGNDTLLGGADADEMYGQDGNDSLVGGDDFATDILVGGEGNDTIDGGAAWDQMYGGLGDDTFIASQQVDWVFESPGEGTDTVIADSPNGYYLYANVENLSLIGTTPFGVGNELANLITGNASANVLLGGAGADTLDGGAGQDLLWGEAGEDVFRFSKGTGLDIVADFQVGVDQLDLSAFGLGSLEEVKARMVQVGTDLALYLPDDLDTIILIGVSLNMLTEIDMVFGPSGG